VLQVLLLDRVMVWRYSTSEGCLHASQPAARMPAPEILLQQYCRLPCMCPTFVLRWIPCLDRLTSYQTDCRSNQHGLLRLCPPWRSNKYHV
jgi:hypothetical protein